jgi:hypothetical protein
MPFESVLPDGDSFIVSEVWAGLGDVGRRRLRPGAIPAKRLRESYGDYPTVELGLK